MVQPVGHCFTWGVQLLLQPHRDPGRNFSVLTLLDEAQFFDPHVFSLVAGTSNCRATGEVVKRRNKG